MDSSMKQYRPTAKDFTPRETQQLSCREAGEYDGRTGQKFKLTGWGKVCKARARKATTQEGQPNE